ncbi:MAG TPA: SDR family NAD(P)-dependent oxidoreductase [Ilumatobacter sp.]|nr:SDR family NAD(P)-dependent oxidoreductase [Ilumatobacter sp.]
MVEAVTAPSRVVVTGAARGIGAQIARRFAADGARVAVIDVIDPADVVDEIGGVGAVCDLTDAVATCEAVGKVTAALGGVDVLVNNAGIFQITPLLDITVDEWDRTFAVNARSMLVTIQCVARKMISQGTGGRIINMASMGAKAGEAGQASYAASKAAVISLTQVAAAELGQYGITVNAICPGYVLTEMGADTRTPEQVAGWSAKSPLGRCGSTDDVAGLAAFLASPDAAYFTGQALNVSGGMILH